MRTLDSGGLTGVRWPVSLSAVILGKDPTRIDRGTPLNGDAIHLSVSRVIPIHGRNLIHNDSFVFVAGKLSDATGSLISDNDMKL